MIVLSCGNNDPIHIGDQVLVTILGQHNGRIRVGITAPREIPVDRDKVWRAKQAEAKPK